MPMGSSISGVIAEAVLQELECQAMIDYRPKFWVRYVDDTFAVIKHRDNIRFMEKLNLVYLDIQFMSEEETNNTLAFLDVLVRRQPDIEYKLYKYYFFLCQVNPKSG